MPQLVEENHQPDANQHGQDASRLADVRRKIEGGLEQAGIESGKHVHESALQARASARVHRSISNKFARDGEESN